MTLNAAGISPSHAVHSLDAFQFLCGHKAATRRVLKAHEIARRRPAVDASHPPKLGPKSPRWRRSCAISAGLGTILAPATVLTASSTHWQSGAFTEPAQSDQQARSIFSMRPLVLISLRMFGRPQGFLGRLGGRIMARMNAECGLWVVDLLEVQPQGRVLEVGFGPGVVIELLSNRAREGLIAGVDPSREMVAQAQARNAAAILRGSVDLRFGSVEQLPFPDNSFDKAIAVNSMQVWPDAPAGLREIRRIMKSGARIALGFTSYSGQTRQGLTETLNRAGFTNTCLRETANAFCALATKS
jgi:hypothetical protein